MDFDRKLSLVLDGIQDPGNMGTIVRVADWFGIEDIICSPDTADIYNPKTVQATMGAIARVKVHYTNLKDFLQKHNHLPIYGTFLEGKNIYCESLSENGFIVMGNEGNGIRPETEKAINRKLFIPSFPFEREASESLNVGVATGIICGEFRRRL
jgi:TrmH family RNA methyltransferase